MSPDEAKEKVLARWSDVEVTPYIKARRIYAWFIWSDEEAILGWSRESSDHAWLDAANRMKGRR